MINLDMSRLGLSGQRVGRVVEPTPYIKVIRLAWRFRSFGPPNLCGSPSSPVLLGSSDPLTRLGCQIGSTRLCLQAHLTRLDRQSCLDC